MIGGKCKKTLDTNGAAFTDVFAGVDFGNVAQGNVSLKKQGYTQDAEGNMKKQIQYSASYTSDNGGSYTVDVSMLGQEDDHFKILISRPDLTEDISLLSVAEHIYQAFIMDHLIQNKPCLTRQIMWPSRGRITDWRSFLNNILFLSDL